MFMYINLISILREKRSCPSNSLQDASVIMCNTPYIFMHRLQLCNIVLIVDNSSHGAFLYTSAFIFIFVYRVYVHVRIYNVHVHVRKYMYMIKILFLCLLSFQRFAKVSGVR